MTIGNYFLLRRNSLAQNGLPGPMIGTVNYRRVREVLRDRRFERRMSVPDLAEEAKVDKTTVYRLEDLENDPDRIPDFETIEKLVEALDMPMSEF